MMSVALLFAGTAAFAAAEPVSRDELMTQFADKWKFYFGDARQSAAAAPDDQNRSQDAVFRELLNQYSLSLDPQDRPAAEAVMRFKLFGDRRVYSQALRNCLSSRVFSPGRNAEILYYLFLEEEIGDPSLMPMALPPGENGQKFYEAFSILGEDESRVRTRLAVFIFRKLIEEKLFKSVKNDLPLVWLSTKGLSPSEAVFGRIVLGEGNPFIKGEFNEDAKGLKLISILTDFSGRIIRMGIGNPGDGAMLIPAEADILYVMLFNPGRETCGEGFSGIVWKDFSVPVSVEGVSLKGQFLEVTIQESSAILGYKIVPSDEETNDGGFAAFPFARSSGEGVHSYLFSVPPGAKLAGRLSLKACTYSGFTLTVPLPTIK